MAIVIVDTSPLQYAASALNSPAFDGTPMLDASGLVLHFTSDRTGSRDLYVAARADPSLPFGTLRAIARRAHARHRCGELNTTSMGG